MPFDEDPDDEYRHYQCEKCSGTIRQSLQNKALWECDTCDFVARGSHVPAREPESKTIGDQK